MKEQILKDFVDWLRDCGEDAFWVFDNTDIAIETYIEYNRIEE